MKIAELYNKILHLEKDEKKKAIRELSKEERDGLIEMCGLSKSTSQKALVQYLENISSFSLSQK